MNQLRMRRRSSLLVATFAALAAAGCGATPGRGADEPALADAARPVALEAPLTGTLEAPCERMVFSFRPTEAGTYDWEVRSEVPMAVRLFAMSPDLYVATGSREGEVSHVTAELDEGVDYAVTVTPRDCRAAPYEVAIARR
ncbi:MAG: hypothetical protein U0353_27570 [Sandaracinus sp.]